MAGEVFAVVAGLVVAGLALWGGVRHGDDVFSCLFVATALGWLAAIILWGFAASMG